MPNLRLMTEFSLHLPLRSEVLQQDAGGFNIWHLVATTRTLDAGSVAILICDMWDKHWSRGAMARGDILAPRIDAVIRAARTRGVRIIHAPSNTMQFYDGTPARQRMMAAPYAAPPEPLPHADPPLPVDASDEGSDTGETSTYHAWSRQHAAIYIDQTVDGISDNGQEVYNYLQQHKIGLLLIMGVHTNMCILRRSFAIKQMVAWQMDVALVRDLTDAMYNPARPPYVSHDEGTRLVVEYIEKFWCPTVDSKDLIAGLYPTSTSV